MQKISRADACPIPTKKPAPPYVVMFVSFLLPGMGQADDPESLSRIGGDSI